MPTCFPVLTTVLNQQVHLFPDPYDSAQPAWPPVFRSLRQCSTSKFTCFPILTIMLSQHVHLFSGPYDCSTSMATRFPVLTTVLNQHDHPFSGPYDNAEPACPPVSRSLRRCSTSMPTRFLVLTTVLTCFPILSTVDLQGPPK